jgi:hypothetical protein
LCWVRVHCSICKNSYNLSNISYLNLPCALLSFIHLHPFLGGFHRVSVLFLHTCVCVFCTIFTFLPPFTATSSSHWYQPYPRQDLFCPPVLLFSKRKRKKWHFCLCEMKIATQGISLWYFHVYIHYYPNCFISSFFLLSTLLPFFMVVSVSLRSQFIYSSIEWISIIFIFFVAFFYPTPLIYDFPSV